MTEKFGTCPLHQLLTAVGKLHGGMVRVVVINNDPTVYCNIDWFHLVCSFYASIFYPFCKQHGLETEKLRGGAEQ